MYFRTLRIGLFGFEDELCDAIESVEAPERFEFEFSRIAVASLQTLAHYDVAIVADNARNGLSLFDMKNAVHSKEIGYKALVVAEHAKNTLDWTEDDYRTVDMLWPRTLSPDRARAEFRRIARQAKQEADAFINETYLNTLIDSAPEMIWFKALDGCHVKVNSYFCEICDKPREDVTNKYHNYIWSVPEEDWDKAELTCKASEDETIARGCTCQFLEHVSTHGEIRLFDTYKTPIYDEDGTVIGTSGFAHDITVEQDLKDLAWMNARTDYLTGLWNRRYLYEFLEEHADEGPMTYVLIDLDNFKEINDGNGHDEGDNTLLVATAVLHKCFPDCQIVRWGGDEFVVVVPDQKSDLASDESIKAFQKTLMEWTAADCPHALTSSIGIACAGEAEEVDDTFKKADKMLYEAKKSGKSTHRRFGA